jgi:hypothetical protein
MHPIYCIKKEWLCGFVLTVWLPGLGASLDMKPNWDDNDYGINMFVVGRAEKEHRLDTDPGGEDISNHLRLSKFLLDKIVNTFIQDQRRENKDNIPYVENIAVPEEATSEFQ